ncbi:MAG: hypothetical protein ACYC2G_03370 [Gemmatimonadaceae bacterium]
MPSSAAVALFWVAVGLCALAQMALLHSFFLGSSRPSRETTAIFRATETTWAVVPALVLVVLLALTWQAMHPSASRQWQMMVPASAPASPALPTPGAVQP